jgi:hypothetical protein
MNERRELSIDEEYSARQPHKGASWTIVYWQPGREHWNAAYYAPNTGVISWTEHMPNDDKEFIETWVKKNLTDQT